MRELKELKELIKSDPDNYLLYKEILNVLFIKHSEMVGSDEAKKYVIETISRFPSEEGDWSIWSTHFIRRPNPDLSVVKLWKGLIDRPDAKKDVINNGGQFCMNLDPLFSVSCFKRLNSHYPNDTEIIESLSQALFRANSYEEAFKYFKQRISISTEINPFVLMEALMSAVWTNNSKEAKKWSDKLRRDINSDDVIRDQIKELLANAKIEGYLE